MLHTVLPENPVLPFTHAALFFTHVALYATCVAASVCACL